MKVLITNLVLWPRTGTVMYVRDLARGLLARGIAPAVLSRPAGPVCAELRAAGVPVVGRCRDLPWVPDVIHGHHGPVLSEALRRFPRVPAINICHDHLSVFERAVVHPAVRRHFGVSEACLRRQHADGVPAASATLLPNFVDLERFRARAPLPARPRRALVFSNYASEATHLPAVREACRRAGLTLDVVGAGVGRASERPEQVLPEYDVVFAKARAALEAMAVGTAVVLCDFGGVGPMVHADAFDRLQQMNFGSQALVGPLTAAHVLEQLAGYDPADVVRVRARVRAQASLDVVLDRLVETYRECIGEGVPGQRPSALQHTGTLLSGLALLTYWAWVSWPPERQHWLRRLRLNAVGRALVGRLVDGRMRRP